MLSDTVKRAYAAYVKATLAINQAESNLCRAQENVRNLRNREVIAMANLTSALSDEANIVEPPEDHHDA